MPWIHKTFTGDEPDAAWARSNKPSKLPASPAFSFSTNGGEYGEEQVDSNAKSANVMIQRAATRIGFSPQ